MHVLTNFNLPKSFVKCKERLFSAIFSVSVEVLNHNTALTDKFLDLFHVDLGVRLRPEIDDVRFCDPSTRKVVS